jgi:hypothetical protein
MCDTSLALPQPTQITAWWMMSVTQPYFGISEKRSRMAGNMNKYFYVGVKLR